MDADSNVDRYHRQSLLSELGPEGTARLRSARVVVVGVGALGCGSADLLARAGVGDLVLVDGDVVDRTNLQRQCLFTEADVGRPKAVAAAERLSAVNSDVRVRPVVEMLTHRNAERIALPRCDALIDGTDNFRTRLLMDDLAVRHGLAYLYGGAVGTVGSAMAILPATEAGRSAWERAGITTPTLKDILGGPSEAASGPTCDSIGVLGPLVTIVSAFQATEAMKVIAGRWSALDGRILQVDPWANFVRRVRPPIQSADGRPTPPTARDFAHLRGLHAVDVEPVCGQHAVRVQAGPLGEGGLEALGDRLARVGEVVRSPWMVSFRPGDGNTDPGEPVELTVFVDGRVIVRGTDRPDAASGLVRRYLGV